MGHHTSVRQGCTAVHPGQKQPSCGNWRTASHAWTHGQPCARSTTLHWCARPCVPSAQPCVGAGSPVQLCTGDRASRHGRASVGSTRFRDFSVFLLQFCFIFLGVLSDFFRADFRGELGFSLGSLK